MNFERFKRKDNDGAFGIPFQCSGERFLEFLETRLLIVVRFRKKYFLSSWWEMGQ